MPMVRQVKSAAHDVDVAKNSDDIRKLERQGAKISYSHSSYVLYVILVEKNWTFEGFEVKVVVWCLCMVWIWVDRTNALNDISHW